MTGTTRQLQMPRLLDALACTAALLAVAACGAAADSAAADSARSEATRVLIVTGEDYKGHHWQETAPVLQAALAADPRLAVEVTEDLRVLRGQRIHDFDALVLHFKNYDPAVPGREGYDNLASFVERGGGLVLVHFACGAFQEFKPDFTRLAGRAWDPELRGHDPHGKFSVEIVDPDHPITQGLESFETTDELYTCLAGTPPIEVLAESRSKVDNQRYPIAFVLQYGEGRVFHTVLGHDVEALLTAGAAELIRRGTAWAGKLIVQRQTTR